MAVSGLTNPSFSSSGQSITSNSGAQTSSSFLAGSSRISHSGTVAGTFGRKWTFSSPQNFSDGEAFIFYAFARVITGMSAFDKATNTGIKILLGSSNTDWKQWLFGGPATVNLQDANLDKFPFFVDLSSTADLSGGTLNLSAVTYIEFSYNYKGDSTASELQFGGTPRFIKYAPIATGETSLDEIYTYITTGHGLTPQTLSIATRQGESQYFFWGGFKVGDNTTLTNSSFSNASIVVADTQAGGVNTSQRFTSKKGRAIEFRSSAGGSHTVNAIFLSTPTLMEFEAGTDTSVNSLIVQNAELFVTDITARGSQFINCLGLSPELSLQTSGINGGADVLLADTTSTLNRVTLKDKNLQLICTPGDNLSDITLEFQGTSTLLLNPTASGDTQINLSGLSGDSISIDNLTGNNIAIVLNEGQVFTVASPTSGGGTVSVVAPLASITLNVTGPTEYYVIIEQGGIRLNTGDEGVKTGTYTWTISGTGIATVRVRKQGWRPFATTVDLDAGSSSVNARLAAKLDVVGESLYTGTTSTLCNVVIDPADLAHRVDIGDGTVNAQVVFDELENALVSEQGMLVDNLTNYNFARIEGLPRALGLPSQIKVRSDNPANVNSGVRGALFHSDDAPIDGVNGPVRIIERLGDWTDQELLEIRYRLGIDGDTQAPIVNTPNLGTSSNSSGDITSIAGNTQAATNLLNILSGSSQIRANLVQIDGDVVSASAPVNFDNLGTISEGIPKSNEATAQLVTSGTVIAGSFSSTEIDDGTYFSVAPTATGLDFYLEFAIGSQFPSSITINGRYAAATNKFCNVFAWNWLTNSWEQISDSLTRINHSTSDANYAYSLLGRHREGSGTGRVRIRFYSTDINTGYRLNIDQIILKSASASISASEIAEAVRQRVIVDSYRRDFGPTIDTVTGAAGRVIGDNGIPQNPVDNLADALVIALDPRIKAKQFFIMGGSVLTIPQNFTDWGFLGQNEGVLWSVNLSGRTLPGCVFTYARVTGTGLSTTTRLRFNYCVFDNTTLGNAIAFDSVLASNAVITAVSGADISIRSSYTVDTFGLPVIDFANPTGPTRVRIQGHNGSLAVRNMNENAILQFSGNGQLVLESTCIAGQVYVENDAFVLNNGTVTVTRLTTNNEVLDAITTAETNIVGNFTGVAKTTELFNPLTDTVARVALVDVTTTNTDMRGTDGALLASSYVAPDNAGIAAIPTYFADLIDYGDTNWSSNDLTSIESNIGLLLDKNMLTLGKQVIHSPTSIIIGNNEATISLVVDEVADTVTGTRIS